MQVDFLLKARCFSSKAAKRKTMMRMKVYMDRTMIHKTGLDSQWTHQFLRLLPWVPFLVAGVVQFPTDEGGSRDWGLPECVRTPRHPVLPNPTSSPSSDQEEEQILSEYNTCCGSDSSRSSFVFLFTSFELHGTAVSMDRSWVFLSANHNASKISTIWLRHIRKLLTKPRRDSNHEIDGYSTMFFIFLFLLTMKKTRFSRVKIEREIKYRRETIETNKKLTWRAG